MSASSTKADKRLRRPSQMMREQISHLSLSKSHCGALFNQYWENQNFTGKLRIPDVQCKFKVASVRHFDDKDGSVEVDFLLMLDWEDPSLSLAIDDGNGGKADTKEIVYDPKLHFIPRFELLNVQAVVGMGDKAADTATPRQKPSKNHPYRMTMTNHFAVKVNMLLDFREFPFDEQSIELTIKAKSASNGAKVNFCHPTFRSIGHEVLVDADRLQQWDIDQVRAGLDPPKHQRERKDTYTLQMIVSRDASSLFWQALFPLFCIDLLSMTSFGYPILKLQAREGAVMSLFLTVMAFKFVLNQKLPVVPYLTSIDIYASLTFVLLFLQGLLFWLLHELALRVNDPSYRSDQIDHAATRQTNWFTGVPTNHTGGVDPIILHTADKMCMMFFVSIIILKNLWYCNFATKIRGRRRMEKLSGVTTLINARSNGSEYELAGGQNINVGFVEKDEPDATTPLLGVIIK